MEHKKVILLALSSLPKHLKLVEILNIDSVLSFVL